MLDEFRSTSITWDKATRRIYSPITANASDSNGRKLNIQVVNSGQVENLTGATLHLYWETKDKAHDGLDAFDASDISKGEFELFYTTGMLSNVGELNATLVLVDGTGKVVSDWFKITVTRGINEGAIESENSFSSLTQALIDVSNLEQNYAPRLNDLTAQLQQIAKVIKVDGVDGTLAIQTAINDGYTNLVIPTCEIDTLQLLDDKSYTFNLKGKIKHKDNATDDMVKSGVGSRINIIGGYFEIDGNFSNQTSRVNLFTITGAKSYVAFNVNYRNIKKRAIEGKDSTLDALHLEGCKFNDADIHTGTLNEGTGFISLFGGNITIINACDFIQSVDPLPNQNRNPGGIFISGGNDNKVIVVTNCYFENLGHNVAGNLESPLDIYSYAKQVTYENNRFRKSRFNPFRITNAGISRIANNDVVQDVPIINDGGAAYPDASCFNCGILGRGYAANDKDNESYLFENNSILVDNVNCRGFTASNDSATYIVEKIILKNNSIKSIGSNTSIGILINRVKDTIIDNSAPEGFGEALRIQDTVGGGLATKNASLSIEHGELKTKGNGLFCRTGVANLHVNIDKVDFTGVLGLAYTIRSAKSININNSEFLTNTGDTANNESFYFMNNITPAIDPAGYTTNDYYRLFNNTGRVDRTSEPELEREPIRSTSLTNMQTLVPLYIGELFMDSNNNDFWVGYALTEGSWKKITGV